jgi:phenylpyruvate tautomerase PptA (4-oxalocrotonate tautomerase family)
MPIIRVDIPEGQSQETKQTLYDAVHHAIATTWADEHIWITLSEKFSPAGDQQVLMTVDLRPGRGDEEKRLRALFDVLQPKFEKAIGTTPENMIVLIRDFPQEACLSGGAPLPPLDSLTPRLDSAEAAE